MCTCRNIHSPCRHPSSPTVRCGLVTIHPRFIKHTSIVNSDSFLVIPSPLNGMCSGCDGAGSAPPSVTTAAACCAACSASTNCDAWTLTNAKCYLKRWGPSGAEEPTDCSSVSGTCACCALNGTPCTAVTRTSTPRTATSVAPVATTHEYLLAVSLLCCCHLCCGHHRRSDKALRSNLHPLIPITMPASSAGIVGAKPPPPPPPPPTPPTPPAPLPPAPKGGYKNVLFIPVVRNCVFESWNLVCTAAMTTQSFTVL